MSYKPGPNDRITDVAGKSTRRNAMTGDYARTVLDEIVLSGVDVHLEQMDNDSYSLNFYAHDGGHEALLIQAWIRRAGKDVHVTLNHVGGTDAGLIP